MQNESKTIEIARMGHPVLALRAKEVDDVQSREIQNVIDDLLFAHEQEGGAGIAAPQIFIPLRIIVFQVTPACSFAKGIPETEATVFVNPSIEVLDDTPQIDWEGCLSVPGMYGEVERPMTIKYKALDRRGKRVEETLTGYAARIVQHEIDHINGKLYPMRVKNFKRFGFVEEVRKYLLD